MQSMKTEFTHPGVAEVFSRYPPSVRKKMLALRKLVIEGATALNKLDSLEETLKWQEPSYLVKGGSTLRMDWKADKPSQYAMYFTCNTKLVDTFRELFGDRLNYEGNRAVIFKLDDELPVAEVRHCIRMALDYRRLKALPLLGGL